MISKVLKLENETWLHARPATELAKIAMKYSCDIKLIANEKTVNAKSPLMIMSAGIKQKTNVEVICDGADEKDAMNEIEEAFKNNFGE